MIAVQSIGRYTIDGILKRVKKLSKLFSLNFSESKIMNLVALGKLHQSAGEFIISIHKFIQSNFPDHVDIQFGLRPLFKMHTNSYGSNHNMHFEILDKLVIDYIYIVVYFPQITIKNSKDQSKLIKDIYVKIPIYLTHAGTRREFQKIEGTRTTLSASDYKAGYFHSHLQARGYRDDGSGNDTIEDRNNRFTNYTQFCLGEADILANQSLLNSDYSEEYLGLMILGLETFLSWESLEGVPYTYMEHTMARRDLDLTSTNIATATTIYNIVEDKIKSKRVSPDLTWKFHKGKYKIVDDEIFEDFLRECLRDYISNRAIYFYRDQAGVYYTSDRDHMDNMNTRDISREISQQWIPFKGKKIYFKIEDDNTEDRVIEAKKYLHPKIKSYVRSKLEYSANSQKIREVGIAKLYSSDYI